MARDQEASPGIGQRLPGALHAQCVYMDYNGTTPVFPEVFAAMLPFLTEQCGNPSSPHAFGIVAREAVAQARRQVAQLINCEPEEVLCVPCACSPRALGAGSDGGGGLSGLRRCSYAPRLSQLHQLRH